MIVEIKNSSERLGVKKGELYKAQRYHFDPMTKVTLEERIPDGHDPMVNMYYDEVKVKEDYMKDIRCPKCNRRLVDVGSKEYFACGNIKCNKLIVEKEEIKNG